MTKKIIPTPTSIEEISTVEALHSELGISANDINGELQYPEGVEPPLEEAITQAKQNLLEKYQLAEYKNKRYSEYPAIVEQLDALYHDIANGTLDQNGSFFTVIKSIKDKYPKP